MIDSRRNKLAFLYLSQEDLLQAGVTDMRKCVDAIDRMFKVMGQGDYLMSGPDERDHGAKLFFPKRQRSQQMPVAGPDRRFTALVSYLGGEFNVCSDKWYGSNIANKDKGLPRSILMLTLNNVETGQPLAYMSANLISAMRTGASPGVAARYLSRSSPETLAVVGAGIINRACAAAILTTQPHLSTVKVFDLAPAAAQEFAGYVEKELERPALICNSLEECARDSDIITTATAGAAQPEFRDEWLKEGCLLLLTGAAILSEKFHRENTVVADNWQMNVNMAEEYRAWENLQAGREVDISDISYLGMGGAAYKMVRSGVLEERRILDLSDIAFGKVAGRRHDQEKIVYISGGLPTADAAWGYTLYQEAVKRGLGQKLPIWEEPYWR